MLFTALLIAAAVAPVPRGWRLAFAAVEAGIRRRLFPGAVVVVGRRDSIVLARGFGRLSWDRNAPEPDPGTTLWDLASLTKVVATASSVMWLVDRGLVDLDRPVANYLPRFAGPDKSRVTVRMLLDHSSGLPAFVPFYREARSRDEVVEALYREPLVAPPGAGVRYSDLNAMLLGLVVETASGLPLDRLAARAVFEPLGLEHATFAVADKTRVAPSSADRGRPAPGLVSDRNSRVMGGVAGHAGLFATGLDLARFAQAWLAARGRDSAWVRPATIRTFLEHRAEAGTRALGWDSPDLAHLDRSPFGKLATRTMFGHTGWTGTFLWFDPARDLFLVFLTNRSLGPTTGRTLRAMREVRARLSDAVASRHLSR